MVNPMIDLFSMFQYQPKNKDLRVSPNYLDYKPPLTEGDHKFANMTKEERIKLAKKRQLIRALKQGKSDMGISNI